MKKLASVLAAGILFATLSMTAFATDYSSDPNYEAPQAGSGATADTAAELVTKDTISNAVNSGNPVYIKNTAALLKADAISELAKAAAPITFVAPNYSLTIDPAAITAAKDLDLSFAVTAPAAATTVSGAAIPAGAIVINPAASGEFGLTVALTLPASALGALDSSSAKLFYISDAGEVSQMANPVWNVDGSVTIRISHASQYVLATSAPTAAPADDADNADTGSASMSAAWLLIAVAGLAAAFGVSRKLRARA